MSSGFDEVVGKVIGAGAKQLAVLAFEGSRRLLRVGPDDPDPRRYRKLRGKRVRFTVHNGYIEDIEVLD